MSAREITVTVERKGLAHVSVLTWSDDAGDMVNLRAGSVEDGRFCGLGSGVELSDEERAIAIKAAR